MNAPNDGMVLGLFDQESTHKHLQQQIDKRSMRRGEYGVVGVFYKDLDRIHQNVLGSCAN